MNVWICLIFWIILIAFSNCFFSSYFSAFCSEPTPPTPHGWIYGDIKMSNHRKYWGVPETKIIECLQNMPINSFHSTSTFAASGTKCIFALFKKAVKRELLIFTFGSFPISTFMHKAASRWWNVSKQEPSKNKQQQSKFNWIVSIPCSRS